MGLNVGLKVWPTQNIGQYLHHRDVKLGVVYQLIDNHLKDGMLDNELCALPINKIKGLEKIIHFPINQTIGTNLN